MRRWIPLVGGALVLGTVPGFGQDVFGAFDPDARFADLFDAVADPAVFDGAGQTRKPG